MKNLKIYFSLTLLNNFWFITSNWLNFWLKYMSMKEVGIIDGVAFLIGILFEFPSGFISDRFGRKTSLILAQLLQFAGSFVITFATNLYEIGAGFIIFQLGISMYSGSIESFGYESSIKSKFDYSKTLNISAFLNNFGYLFSLLIGGYLYLVNNNYPNILFTLSFFIGFCLSLIINENLEYSENSCKTIKEDNILLLKAIKSMDPKIFLYIVVISSLVFAFDYGFLKLILLDTFSNINTNYWFIFGFTGASLILSYFLLKLKTSYLNQLRIMFGLTLIILFLNHLNKHNSWLLFAYLSFLVIYINQVSLAYFNNLVEDTNRAGFLSLFSLLYKLPYVFISLILGEYLLKQEIAQIIYPTLIILLGLYLAGKLGYNMTIRKWGRSSVAE